MMLIAHQAKAHRAGHVGGRTVPTVIRAEKLFLGLLMVLLLGYALLGRGMAYIGAPPLFAGEIVLLVGLFGVGLRWRAWRCLSSPVAAVLVLWMAWCAARTVVFLPVYGIDALRDAAVWGYALFALLVAGVLIGRPECLQGLLRRYQWFAVCFPLCMVVLWPVQRAWPHAIPRLLHGEPIMLTKPGDILVHLAGIAVFVMVGLSSRVPPVVGIAFASLAILATTGRGAILAFVCALGFAAALWPVDRRLLRWCVVGVVLFVMLVATGLEIHFPGASRTVSARALTRQFTSIFVSTDAPMDNTKQWRLEWWRDIVEDVTAGDHLFGRGFGYNLAHMHDVALTGPQAKVRSPHNVHLTVMARAGLPGLVLWIALHGGWLVTMLHGYFRAMARSQRDWAGLFLWLSAYWIAFMVNGSFDVYIEGPMGGIWFWTVFGVGIGAVAIFRQGRTRAAGGGAAARTGRCPIQGKAAW